MNPDRIEQLLRETDQHAVAPQADASDLASRVLRANRGRTGRNIALSIASLAIISAAAAVVVSRSLFSKPAVHGRVPQYVAADPAPDASDQKLAQLQSEIAIREARVRSMLASERRIELNARLSELSALPIDDDATERAASAMVYQADRLLREGAEAAPAVQTYHQVISCFPRTISAELARKRVADLSLQKEG